MEITADMPWNAFLRDRGLQLIDKKLPILSTIKDGKHRRKLSSGNNFKFIETTKTDTYVKYEVVKEYTHCRVSGKSVKALGTKDAIYFMTVNPGGEELKLFNLGINIDESVNEIEFGDIACEVRKGWTIGKDLNEKQITWAEQFVDVKRISDQKIICKVVHKFWKYTPNNDMWGESNTEKILGAGLKVTAIEVWKDNVAEKFRDFWANQSIDGKEVYSYGQKETFTRSGEAGTRVIERWEKKTEGEDSDFNYNEKYTLEPDGKLQGTKDGKRGSEDFHEKWSVIDGTKITEKWSEQTEGNTLKKWGKILKNLNNGIEEIEDWNEIHKTNEGYYERHMTKYGFTENRLKYRENYYENSAKKVWHEKWEESADKRIVLRHEDDGFGNKLHEIKGEGFGETPYSFSDKFNENISSGEKYTEKRGYSSNDGNKWVCIINDSPDKNYVENAGENIKTKDKWVEKWFDNKKGMKWSSKEGSRTSEDREWKEKWHERRSGSGDHQPPIEKSCEKWGRHASAEWLEKWNEEYDEISCKHKFCEKTYKDGSYHRGHRVDQYLKGKVDGKELWKYKVEFWENDVYKINEFEQYE